MSGRTYPTKPAKPKVSKICFHCGRHSEVFADLPWVCAPCGGFNEKEEGPVVSRIVVLEGKARATKICEDIMRAADLIYKNMARGPVSYVRAPGSALIRIGLSKDWSGKPLDPEKLYAVGGNMPPREVVSDEL